MGTLDTARKVLAVRRRRQVDPYRAPHVAAAIKTAIAYKRDLIVRSALAREAYDDEIEDLEDVIHDLAILEPMADPEAVWRGRTRGGLRVAVVRAGQTVVGRRGRARVEDCFIVAVDNQMAFVGRRKAAFKQARKHTSPGTATSPPTSG